MNDNNVTHQVEYQLQLAQVDSTLNESLKNDKKESKKS